MDNSDLLKKLKDDIQNFGNILWDSLTPFERDRVLKRINKQIPEIQEKYKSEKNSRDATGWTPPDSSAQKKPKIEPKAVSKPSPEEAAPTKPKEHVSSPYERSMWNMKTLYQVAHQDMIEQRTTIMKFLLENYGIEAVEEFFLHQNPHWSETLKVGKLKKIFAKLISKLSSKLILNKLSDIIIENAQYLVPLTHMTIREASDEYKLIEISKCPVLKQFKKTIKTLKVNDFEKRYICTFACVPVLAQMAAVGNCAVASDYTHDEKGCLLRVSLKAKEPEMVQQAETDSFATLKNGPS